MPDDPRDFNPIPLIVFLGLLGIIYVVVNSPLVNLVVR